MILRYAMPVPGESDGAAPLLHMARAHDQGNTAKKGAEREDWLSLAVESQNTLGLLLDARTHATSRSRTARDFGSRFDGGESSRGG